MPVHHGACDQLQAGGQHFSVGDFSPQWELYQSGEFSYEEFVKTLDNRTGLYLKERLYKLYG